MIDQCKGISKRNSKFYIHYSHCHKKIDFISK